MRGASRATGERRRHGAPVPRSAGRASASASNLRVQVACIRCANTAIAAHPGIRPTGSRRPPTGGERIVAASAAAVPPRALEAVVGCRDGDVVGGGHARSTVAGNSVRRPNGSRSPWTTSVGTPAPSSSSSRGLLRAPGRVQRERERQQPATAPTAGAYGRRRGRRRCGRPTTSGVRTRRPRRAARQCRAVQARRRRREATFRPATRHGCSTRHDGDARGRAARRASATRSAALDAAAGAVAEHDEASADARSCRPPGRAHAGASPRVRGARRCGRARRSASPGRLGSRTASSGQRRDQLGAVVARRC